MAGVTGPTPLSGPPAPPGLVRPEEKPGSDGEEGELHPIGAAKLSILALIVGVVTGFGAVAFRELIGLIHNALFVGALSFHYDANVFTPLGHLGAFVILVPVVGSLVVTFLVITFAPEARGHGVPEVMDAIYYQSGLIRPIVAVVKSLASAVAIGSGAAVGREGPIIQIGSALGSTLGQLVTMPSGQRIILVAAGSGAGIAATFNTPIGGVLFAIELMMPEVSARTFLPVALATGTATFIGRLFFGNHPAFIVPHLVPMGTAAGSPLLLCLYGLLGALTGVAAAAFVRGLQLMEDLFDGIKERYTRHAAGMLIVGLLIYLLQRRFGHYYVEGVGYSTIQAILFGEMSTAGLLLLLAPCKLLATSLSLGSGSSGGIFSPSLFMGATLGGGFAAAIGALHLPLGSDIRSFAMVGMGAMVGGATGAAMTAVTMIFEMTRDYDIVLPMIVAVALSVGVRRLLSRENIYTFKLARRGHAVPKALQANMFLVARAGEVMDKNFVLAPADMTFDAFLAGDHHAGLRHLAVVDGQRIVGVLRVNTALRQTSGLGRSTVTLRDIMSHNFTIVGENDILYEVIQRMWRRGAGIALVVHGKGIPRSVDITGVITKEQVADSVADSIKVYPS